MINESRLPTPESWQGEFEIIDDPRPVRQGDIIFWEKQSSPWEVLGIIITGDCDIDKNKYGEIFSYVPLLPLEDYWRLLTLPSKISHFLSAKLRPSLIEKMKSIPGKYHSEANALSEDAIIDLLTDNEPRDTLNKLEVPQNEHAMYLPSMNAFKKAYIESGARTLTELVALLVELREATGAKQVNRESILKELADSVRQLPGDAFFVGRVSPKHSEGYVAYLRVIRELKPEMLALQPKDLIHAHCRRIARLKQPYIHRLTQQLAQVFADIGLPKEYEDARNGIASTRTSEISKKP